MCMSGSGKGGLLGGIAGGILAPLVILGTGGIAAPAMLEMLGDSQRRQSEVDYANRIARANREQMDENRNIATRAYLDQAEAAQRNLAESREAAAAENFDKTRESMKARGDALASAAEAGVGGNSLAAILDDFTRQEGLFKQRNQQNLLFKEQQTNSQVKSYFSEAKARTAAIKPIIQSPIKQVDYIGPMLKVGTQMANMAMPMMGKK